MYCVFFVVLSHTTLLLGENREKNEAAERRNRQALKEIGNLVAKQAENPCANVPKRITRCTMIFPHISLSNLSFFPISSFLNPKLLSYRSSFAQLPANGQVAAEKSKV